MHAHSRNSEFDCPDKQGKYVKIGVQGDKVEMKELDGKLNKKIRSAWCSTFGGILLEDEGKKKFNPLDFSKPAEYGEECIGW